MSGIEIALRENSETEELLYQDLGAALRDFVEKKIGNQIEITVEKYSDIEKILELADSGYQFSSDSLIARQNWLEFATHSTIGGCQVVPGIYERNKLKVIDEFPGSKGLFLPFCSDIQKFVQENPCFKKGDIVMVFFSGEEPEASPPHDHSPSDSSHNLSVALPSFSRSGVRIQTVYRW